MSPTTLKKPPAPSCARPLPTFGEMLGEVLPLVGVVVVAGPPVILLAAPLVLGALLLAGPFALAVTLVAVVVVTQLVVAALVELGRGVVATSCRLVRRRPQRRQGRAHTHAPARRRVAIGSRQAAA
jgi:hypothetical protein